MKTKICFLLVICSYGCGLFLAGCSATSQMARAEKRESAAVTKVDTDQGKIDHSRAAIMSRVADYNRDAAYLLTLPLTAQSANAGERILSLQYNLTGPAEQAETARIKFVADLLSANAQAGRELAQAASDDHALVSQLDAAKKEHDADVIERGKDIAAEHALASINAGQADKLNDLWDLIYGIIALGIAIFALWAFEKWGQAAATVAAKV